MSIEKNEKIVGMGSWHCNQSYNDYSENMEFHEYRRHIYNQCKMRFESMNLQEGDKISFIYIGGHKPRKYTGVFEWLSSNVHIKQKNRNVSFDITLIDDVEIIAKAVQTNTAAYTPSPPFKLESVVSIAEYKLNKADLVFERISEGLYVMVSNKHGECSHEIYDQFELNQLEKSYKIEIKQLLQ